MTTTKHEGKCTCPMFKKNGYCSEFPPEPTGAGMEERFEEQFKDWKFHHEGLPCFNDALVKVAVLRFIDSELSRLHSRIVEEGRKARLMGFEMTFLRDDKKLFNDTLDTYEEIINQAFKDL